MDDYLSYYNLRNAVLEWYLNFLILLLSIIKPYVGISTVMHCSSQTILVFIVMSIESWVDVQCECFHTYVEVQGVAIASTNHTHGSPG